ncbi:multidrug effflux MFS transporter [Solirubrobacter phytolaccae]|uniref:Multidrug effflux MFS transporter n=1 Tax=Solirubrobacter phytolaccae TaxID=1404360 RepID=A0A9X3N654_9ACTN|nr:multidrug effflux MFS transporter [Solirubrobacter phytolaccae]MDA0180398.1 multidrug effflux MFS transporter [Solirubrobacter phytolaccae]
MSVQTRSTLSLALLLGGLSAVGPLSLDMYLPGLPELGRDLSASASATQLSLTACLAGLALGQLAAGPISDRVGRRTPVLIGSALFAAASLACVFAPSIGVLITLRFLQGIGGAAGIVIGRAVVRDLYSGDAAAKLFSSLMLVGGIAPILAPVWGAQVLAFTTWQGVFVVLAVVGVLLLLAAAIALPESLAPGPRARADLRGLLRDRRFVALALCSGLMMAAMFAYIAGSPFVLQTIHGLSEQAYSLVFAVNGLGILGASFASRRLIGRVRPAQLLSAGVAMGAIGAATLLAAVLADAPVGVLLAALFLVVSSIGLTSPNATALALADHPRNAGAASALLGTSQFLLGAAAAPLVGLAGEHTAVPMAVTIAALVTFAAICARRS